MTASHRDVAAGQDESAVAVLTTEAARLGRSLGDHFLPFWSTTGFDAGQDMFHECADLAGGPVTEVPRRAMVQARQIYVFSHAALCGSFPAGAALVERALHTLLARFTDDPGSGFAFSVDPRGTPHSTVRDSYAHAFILFALAWSYRLTGDPKIRAAIDATLGFVDRRLADQAQGGLHDRHPSPSAVKSQNPQMHFLEALLALHEACPEGPYLDRATAIVGLFTEKILRRAPCRIPELCGSDWSDPPDPTTLFFEPGHHFEWVWLLDWYERASGAPVSDVGPHLWQSATVHGIGPRGAVFDEVAFDLRPRKRTHRLWPHAEGAKAAMVRMVAGDLQASATAAAMLQTLNERFLGRPFVGGWTDRIDPDGHPLIDSTPASSLYHIYGAWAESRRLGVTV